MIGGNNWLIFFNNEKNLFHRSVGVILFEFIVGAPPFNDDTKEKVFDNIKNLRIPWDAFEIGLLLNFV